MAAPTSRKLTSKVSRTTPSHSHTEAGTLRKRAQRACSQCHSHKTKCSGDLPRCKRCEAANLPCEYTPAKRRFTNVRFQRPDKSLDTHPPAPASVARSDGIISPTLSSSSGGGGPGPGSATLLTEASSLNAEYVAPPSKAPGTSSTDLTASSGLRRDILARKHLILRHMDAYMDNVYWLPSQGFVHPDSTYRDIHVGAP